MPRVTVQSIADTLGLSKFAVSRALSGKSGVSEETRRLVVETAEKQGYRARSARRSEASPVRVLVRNAAVAKRELWIDVRNGVELQAVREKFSVEFQLTEDPAEIEGLAAASRGLILIGPMPRSVYEAVQASDVPAVAVVHELPPLLTIDRIGCTDAESGGAVGEFLLGKGHRKLVYVHGQIGFPGRNARLRGFEASVEGVPDAEIRQIAFPEDYAPLNFVQDLSDMLADGFRPTAFFCGSDGVAVTVLNELHRLGLKVPLDCSVVGHADYPLATQVTPNLTTIHMPHREMGMEAVRLLRKQVEGTDSWLGTGSVRLSLVVNLVERESTGEVGSPDWSKVLSAGRSAAE